MSDDEVGNIMKGLSEFWSRSMRERGTSGKKGGSQVRGGKRDSKKIKAPSPGEEVKSLFRKIDENYKGKRRPSEREVLSSIPSNRLSKVAGSRTLTTEQWNRARKIMKKVYPAEESGIDPKDPIFDIALGRRKPLTLKLKGAALARSRKASQEVDAAARDED